MKKARKTHLHVDTLDGERFDGERFDCERFDSFYSSFLIVEQAVALLGNMQHVFITITFSGQYECIVQDRKPARDWF